MLRQIHRNRGKGDRQMDTIYVLRGRIQEVYARHTKIIDKAGQFILAVVVFTLINHNVGFMDAFDSPVVALALAVICAFLPLLVTVLAATALVLAHMFSASLGALLVTAAVFLILYIFYLRLTPKMALLVLLTPIAFFLENSVCDPYRLRSGTVAGQYGCGSLRHDRVLHAGICQGKCFISGRGRRPSDPGDYISETGVSG